MLNLINISSTEDAGLALFREPSEVQLRRMYEPEPGIFIAETELVVRRALEAGYKPICALVEKELLTTLNPFLNSQLLGDIPVYCAPHSLLIEVTGYNVNRGILVAMMRTALPGAEEICTPSVRRIAVLEGVTNPTNVGAIFRSAAAMYIDAVLLTPDCADPLYRRSLRVSMGNVFAVPWTYVRNDWPAQLKSLGFTLCALALSDDSISIADPILKARDRLALILGSEGYGLRESTIASCDHVVLIPMAEGVDSLNVAAASALAFWETRPNKI